MQRVGYYCFSFTFYNSCFVDVNDNAIRIQKNYKLLVNNIVSTTDVTDYLIENFIIQHEDREEICASGLTTNESNRRLIDTLLYKNGYHHLLKALQHAEYIQIAHEVSNTVVSKSDQKLYHIGKHALMLMGFFPFCIRLILQSNVAYYLSLL